MNIRLAKHSDEEQLVKLFETEFANVDELRCEFNIAIDIGFTDTVFLVYEQDNSVLGFICFDNCCPMENTHSIKWLIVDENFRNRTIGSQLLSVTLAVLRNYEVHYIILMTNIPTFFQRFGFSKRDDDMSTFKLMSKVIGTI